MTFKLSDLLPCKYLDIDEAIANQQIFQDAEGKITCTEDGQLVGLIKYSDGSTFLKEPCASNRPTLKSDKDGKHYIEGIDEELV